MRAERLAGLVAIVESEQAQHADSPPALVLVPGQQFHDWRRRQSQVTDQPSEVAGAVVTAVPPPVPPNPVVHEGRRLPRAPQRAHCTQAAPSLQQALDRVGAGIDHHIVIAHQRAPCLTWGAAATRYRPDPAGKSRAPSRRHYYSDCAWSLIRHSAAVTDAQGTMAWTGTHHLDVRGAIAHPHQLVEEIRRTMDRDASSA
ncbi:hypothetical protein ACFT8P_10610 [Streptomyces sp. NPDC057101]|uniref:hypothetical protein n=1 Tax=Streptomyces sp. NPDC057101 TaxID=3346020 RepID=UPI00363EF659